MNRITIFFGLTSLFTFGLAGVQALPVKPDAGLIMRESNQMPVLTKQPLEVDIELYPTKKAMVIPINLKILVRRFIFSGNKHFTANTLQSLLNQYINHEASKADLTRVVTVITDYYEKAGYLKASVYIPEQTFKDGKVELVIMEGQPNENIEKK